jgi:LemA protein
MTAVTVVVLGVVVGAGAVLAFNGLVRARVRTREAWSQIDVELTRRHDLIPNLVETVKGYAAHERGTFAAVTAARAGAISAQTSGDPGRVGPAENVLTGSLRTLFAVAENYPQLRAVESFLQLQEQLTATEDKLEFARHFYNTSVRDYDIAIQTFPRSVLARAFGFGPVGFFETDARHREAPPVSLTGPGASTPDPVRSPGPTSP